MNKATDNGPETLVHEKTYQRRNPLGFVHRARLNTIVDVLKRFVPRSTRSWADFGCSNGFIIEQVLAAGGFAFERIAGYDHSSQLIQLAVEKNIPNTTFESFDMNTLQRPRGAYGLVTCFETLEHVGDYRVAFENLYANLGERGLLVTTVPNETGLPGLIKLSGRRVLGRTTDREFFEGVGTGAYVRCLLRNGYIDGFRDPSVGGYGSHLGFDYRRLYEFVAREFMAGGRLVEVAKMSTTLRMNKIAIYRKVA